MANSAATSPQEAAEGRVPGRFAWGAPPLLRQHLLSVSRQVSDAFGLHRPQLLDARLASAGRAPRRRTRRRCAVLAHPMIRLALDAHPRSRAAAPRRHFRGSRNERGGGCVERAAGEPMAAYVMRGWVAASARRLVLLLDATTRIVDAGALAPRQSGPCRHSITRWAA